jgi:LPS export ABC transporter permease LptF/LPS export ABC transporter permease LptG
MFKSLDRYILKEIASPFAIGLTIYTLALLINNILLLSHTLISRGASGYTILKILLYILPDLLSFTIPMATLMGVLAGLSRMSTDSEIIAFKTMGINNLRILKPVMIFSLITWLFSTWLIMYVAPEANFRSSQLWRNVILSKTISNIKPRTFCKEFPNYVLYFGDIDNKTNEWKNVLLYSTKNGGTNTVIIAEKGNFIQKEKEKDSYIYLKNAIVHEFKKKIPLKNYSLTSYNLLKEKIPNMVQIIQTRRYTQLVFPKLVKRMKDEPENIFLKIEFYRKFSLPFACIALGLLALSLGISTKKGGKISGFIVSLGIIFIYYTIITASRNMVLKEIISPFWGMWSANIFLLLIGIILYFYTSKEKTINWERIFLPFYKIRKSLFAKKPHLFLVFKVKKLNFRLFKIIDLYIIKKLVLTFILVLISLLLIFFIVTIIEMIDNTIENNVAFYYILKYIYYDMPYTISLVLPVSVLTSVLLTFSLMSKNNEITAVQISGISLYRLALPAILLGVIFSILCFYIQENITPNSNKLAQETLNIIYKRNVKTDVELIKNYVVGKNNQFYSYNFFDKKNSKFIKFNIIYINEKFNITRRISTQYAKWIDKKSLILKNGFERTFKDNIPLDFKKFKSKKITIEQGKGLFTKKVAFSQFMNIKKLKKYINYLKENKSDTGRYKAKLFYKYSFPFSSLIMVLIAIPFSFLMGKKGALHGIGIAVGLSMIFWSAIGIFSALGSTGSLSPFISAFAPIFIFLAFSTYLFVNVKT